MTKSLAETTLSACTAGTPDAHLAVLRAVEERVLWLATAIVDHANRVPPNPTELKVGGHQASSASMVSIMTALWQRHTGGGGRVGRARMGSAKAVTCAA
jgi:pyruvate dehydrogenase E1 component